LGGRGKVKFSTHLGPIPWRQSLTSTDHGSHTYLCHIHNKLHSNSHFLQCSPAKEKQMQTLGH